MGPFGARGVGRRGRELRSRGPQGWCVGFVWRRRGWSGGCVGSAVMVVVMRGLPLWNNTHGVPFGRAANRTRRPPPPPLSVSPSLPLSLSPFLPFSISPRIFSAHRPTACGNRGSSGQGLPGFVDLVECRVRWPPRGVGCSFRWCRSWREAGRKPITLWKQRVWVGSSVGRATD